MELLTSQANLGEIATPLRRRSRADPPDTSCPLPGADLELSALLEFDVALLPVTTLANLGHDVNCNDSLL